MKIAPSYPVFAVTFAAVFAVVYLLAVDYQWSLFTYGPATGEFGLLRQPATAGPTMYWYGWIATAAIAAGAVGALASLTPEKLARRFWPGWAWAVPIAVMCGFAYLLSDNFLR
jgi:hypothetical protein